MKKSIGLVFGVFAIAMLLAMTVGAENTVPAPVTDPAAPAVCAAADGVGDVCKLPETSCSCDNVCGQELINDPSFINQYCYADCNPDLENPGCPGATDVCVPFNADMTVNGCLPTGAVNFAWTAKVVKEGTQPGIFDISRLTNVQAQLAGATFPLSMAVGMEASVQPDPATAAQKFVILNFQGVEGSTGMWALQITIPQEKFVAGTLKLEGATADFGAFLIYGKIEGQAVKNLYMKALPAAGTLVIQTATTPGSATKAKGTLTLDLLGFTAEMDATQAQ